MGICQGKQFQRLCEGLSDAELHNARTSTPTPSFVARFFGGWLIQSEGVPRAASRTLRRIPEADTSMSQNPKVKRSDFSVAMPPTFVATNQAPFCKIVHCSHPVQNTIFLPSWVKMQVRLLQVQIRLFFSLVFWVIVNRSNVQSRISTTEEFQPHNRCRKSPTDLIQMQFRFWGIHCSRNKSPRRCRLDVSSSRPVTPAVYQSRCRIMVVNSQFAGSDFIEFIPKLCFFDSEC